MRLDLQSQRLPRSTLVPNPDSFFGKIHLNLYRHGACEGVLLGFSTGDHVHIIRNHLCDDMQIQKYAKRKNVEGKKSTEKLFMKHSTMSLRVLWHHQQPKIRFHKFYPTSIKLSTCADISPMFSINLRRIKLGLNWKWRLSLMALWEFCAGFWWQIELESLIEFSSGANLNQVSTRFYVESKRWSNLKSKIASNLVKFYINWVKSSWSINSF